MHIQQPLVFNTSITGDDRCIFMRKDKRLRCRSARPNTVCKSYQLLHIIGFRAPGTPSKESSVNRDLFWWVISILFKLDSLPPNKLNNAIKRWQGYTGEVREEYNLCFSRSWLLGALSHSHNSFTAVAKNLSLSIICVSSLTKDFVYTLDLPKQSSKHF